MWRFGWMQWAKRRLGNERREVRFEGFPDDRYDAMKSLQYALPS